MLTLHHLETSRSSRVIWLLEALGIEYALVTHRRNAQRRAPPGLQAVHPLGKAPTIVDGDLVLTESATILRHIATRHGEGRFMPPPGTAAARHDEWLDYAESSLMMPLMVNLMGRMGGGLPDALQGFVGPELDKALDYIAAGVGDGPFLMGEDLTLADMQMAYCMAMAAAGGFLAPRPALAAYWQRLQDDPGFRRAGEVGGPLMLAR